MTPFPDLHTLPRQLRHPEAHVGVDRIEERIAGQVAAGLQGRGERRHDLSDVAASLLGGDGGAHRAAVLMAEHHDQAHAGQAQPAA